MSRGSTITHFGLGIRLGKRGVRLTRDNYAVVSNKSSFGRPEPYSDEWCQGHLAKTLLNFDRNMAFFSSLDRIKFATELHLFLAAFQEPTGQFQGEGDFLEVADLSVYDQVSGYYLLVLDQYCQVYLGRSTDIKKRVQAHWARTLPFDRLLFGSVSKSRLSIDSFRALDTTRVFVQDTGGPLWLAPENDMENDYILLFSDEFVCNRLRGGTLTGVDRLEIALDVDKTAIKRRQLPADPGP